MRFTEAFDITRVAEDDWFDPHLTVDPKLFIDPLLLNEAGGARAEAHEELIAYFVHCYGLVVKATSSKSVSAQAARRLLTFPEPFESGLGYTVVGTRGSGAGDRFAARMADDIAVAIASALTQPEHIEEIGILNEGIAAVARTTDTSLHYSTVDARRPLSPSKIEDVRPGEAPEKEVSE